MPRPVRIRFIRTIAIAIGAFALLALSAPAHAAPPRLDEPPTIVAQLSAQRTAALRIMHAAIWEGATAHFRSERELAALKRRARRGDKAAQRGLHARRVEFEADLPVGGALERAGQDVMPLAARRTLAVPLNVRCNDPSSDGTGATQSECGAAGIGNHLVVSWNNGQGIYSSNDIEGVAYSNDGGLTYTSVGPPLHPAGYPSFRWIGDPVIAANEKTGDFYLAGLARTDATHNAIAVTHGRFTGGAFAMDSAWVVRAALNSTTFLDKEWIACDSLSGNVYVTNTTFGAQDTIDLYRSTNGGRSWSSPVKLSSNTDAGWVQGSRVEVAGNGDVEVAWYAGDQVTVQSNLRFRRSTNQGVSFLSQQSPVKFNEQFGTGGPGFNRDWGPNFPSLAVDRSGGPHNGRIYLAWSECWQFLTTPVPVGPPVFDTEINGTAASANPFTVGQTLRGTLNTSFYGVLDQDWYSFPLIAGQNVIVFADSVSVPSGWILRLVAPDGTQRLCRGGESDSSQNTTPSSPAQAYYAFTAPASGTYFLDMYAQSYAPTTYAIKTAFGFAGSERGRDQRDGFASWSDDGTTWSTPARLDDDAVGYDLVYPELAVGSDGAAYVTWFDHRDDTYGSRANLEATRSIDGGLTWAANQPLSSVQSNFTTSQSNLAPNLGDYNGIATAGSLLLAAWGDGRSTASVDAWSTAVDLTSDLTGCPGDTTLTANSSGNFGWTIANHDVVFGGDYGVTLASTRNWPLPAAASVTVAAGASAPYSATISVPDTAADGVNPICLTLRTPAGVVVKQCCFNLTVQGSVLAADAGHAGFSLAPSRPNPAADGAQLAFTLPQAGAARLVVYDLAGARVRTLVDGALAAGPNDIRWDGRDDRGAAVRPGAYFYRLVFNGRTLTRRLVLTR